MKPRSFQKGQNKGIDKPFGPCQECNEVFYTHCNSCLKLGQPKTIKELLNRWFILYYAIEKKLEGGAK